MTDYVNRLDARMMDSDLDKIVRSRMSPLLVTDGFPYPAPSLLKRVIAALTGRGRREIAELDFSFGQERRSDPPIRRTGYEKEARVVALAITLADDIKNSPVWTSPSAPPEYRINLDSELYWIASTSHELLLRMRRTMYSSTAHGLDSYDLETAADSWKSIADRVASLMRYTDLVKSTALPIQQTPDTTITDSETYSLMVGSEINKMGSSSVNEVCEMLDHIKGK